LSRIFIAGIALDALTEKSVLAKIKIFLQSISYEKFLLTTPNPEIVLKAQKNSIFKEVLNFASLATADGIGILWAAHFLSLKKRNFANFIGSLLAILFCPKKIRDPIPARITGTDLFPKILEIAAVQKKKVFLLGAADGVAAKLKTKFEFKIPDLKISGVFAGSPATENEKIICQKIDDSGAEILFVAFGAPQQEIWISRNLSKLKFVRFATGIGGAFDFHAGRISRAPRIFRELGLEWFWRLFRQPKRIGRIWNATFRFIWLIWQSR